MSIRFALCRCLPSLMLCGAVTHAAAQPVPLEHLLGNDNAGEVALSPDGEHLAVTVPQDGRTTLAVLRTSDLKPLTLVDHGDAAHIIGIEWANDERLLYGLGEPREDSAEPEPSGELLAVGADGSENLILIGRRAGTGLVELPRVGRIRMALPELVNAELLDVTDDDPDTVLVAVTPWANDVTYSRVDRMDIRNGRRWEVTRAPVRGATFATDPAGVVRFAVGADVDNASKLYYRADTEAEWKCINDESRSGRIVVPLGFSADGTTAYLRSEHVEGPDSIQAFTVADESIREIARDDDSDPYRLLYSPFDGTPFGVAYMDGLPRTEYFDPDGRAARLHRALEKNFAGQQVQLLQATRDGSKGLIVTSSDRNPGDVYLFDYETKTARFLLARNEALDLDALAPMRPITLQARDGLVLRGYLTLPNGEERNLPLVVMPHGGPFGVQDAWGFDPDVQMLATHGYAVMQVDFRGSAGHGRTFARAGYRQWGGAMQRDLTDATRWALEQGIADPARICIYGASYGAYAAMMGAIQQPGLYRCAIGHLGVYDLELMYRRGDVQRRESGENYLAEVLGHDRLRELSPIRLVDRIEIPVLLSAGEEDQRAPPTHTERMAKALHKAGKQVDSKIYPLEGHGLYRAENRMDHARRVLAFLDRHIGRAANSKAVRDSAGDRRR